MEHKLADGTIMKKTRPKKKKEKREEENGIKGSQRRFAHA